MRARIVIGAVVLGSTALAGVAFAAPTRPATSVPPACVVVSGPSGATLQVGYAPNGPSDCTALP